MDCGVSSHPDEIQDDGGKNLEMMHLRQCNRKSCQGSQIDLIQTWMGWSTKMRVLTGPFNSHQLILATLQPRKRCSTDCRWLDESGRLGSSVFGSRWVDESGNVSLVGKKGNFPEKCLSLSCNLSFQRVFHSELDNRLVRVGLNCWSITWANRNIGTAFWIL